MGVIFRIEIDDGALESGEISLFSPELDPLRFRAEDGSYFLGEPDLALLRQRGLRFKVIDTHREDELPVRFILPHAGAVNNPPPEGARLAVLAKLLAENRADGGVHVRFLGRNRTLPHDGFLLDRAGGRRRYIWQLISAEQAASLSDLGDRFRALRSLFGDPRTRVALSLGSGGLKLFAHAAALRLLERIGCLDDVDEVWGSSGGAIVGLLLCHGLSPQAIEQAGYDLYSGRYSLNLFPSKLQVLRRLARDTLLPTKSSKNSGFVDCAEGLSSMIDRYCASIRTRRPLYCPAFNLRECRTQVLTPEEVPAHLEEHFVRAGARDAALASAAVPLLFIPRDVSIGGEVVPFVDGSTTEDVPLWSIARKFDLDRAAGAEDRERLVILYVKLTPEVGQYRQAAGRISKLRVIQMVASAGIDTMHRRDVELLRRRPDVHLLPLEIEDQGVDFFDLEKIPTALRSAKERFPVQLANIERVLRGG